MFNLVEFIHLAAAVVWMGGMVFMVLALRPALGGLEPAVKLPLLAAILRRFFVLVIASIAVLLASGAWMFQAAEVRPPGWHAMAAIGLVMSLIFGHIYFVPYRRLGKAVARQAWPDAGAAAGQVTLLAKLNLGLGWLAIAAVMLWH